jgi:hypothetical protein
MDVNRLKMMVIQIDQNIAFAGSKAEVIATHLRKFWTPQMRKDIFQEIEKNPADFSQDVQAALKLLHGEAKA